MKFLFIILSVFFCFNIVTVQANDYSRESTIESLSHGGITNQNINAEQFIIDFEAKIQKSFNKGNYDDYNVLQEYIVELSNIYNIDLSNAEIMNISEYGNIYQNFLINSGDLLSYTGDYVSISTTKYPKDFYFTKVEMLNYSERDLMIFLTEELSKDQIADDTQKMRILSQGDVHLETGEGIGYENYFIDFAYEDILSLFSENSKRYLYYDSKNKNYNLLTMREVEDTENGEIIIAAKNTVFEMVETNSLTFDFLLSSLAQTDEHDIIDLYERFNVSDRFTIPETKQAYLDFKNVIAQIPMILNELEPIPTIEDVLQIIPASNNIEIEILDHNSHIIRLIIYYFEEADIQHTNGPVMESVYVFDDEGFYHAVLVMRDDGIKFKQTPFYLLDEANTTEELISLEPEILSLAQIENAGIIYTQLLFEAVIEDSFTMPVAFYSLFNNDGLIGSTQEPYLKASSMPELVSINVFYNILEETMQ